MQLFGKKVEAIDNPFAVGLVKRKNDVVNATGKRRDECFIFRIEELRTRQPRLKTVAADPY